eukprot:1194780-Rhodomonas_salina.4
MMHAMVRARERDEGGREDEEDERERERERERESEKGKRDLEVGVPDDAGAGAHEVEDKEVEGEHCRVLVLLPHQLPPVVPHRHPAQQLPPTLRCQPPAAARALHGRELTCVDTVLKIHDVFARPAKNA